MNTRAFSIAAGAACLMAMLASVHATETPPGISTDNPDDPFGLLTLTPVGLYLGMPYEQAQARMEQAGFSTLNGDSLSGAEYTLKREGLDVKVVLRAADLARLRTRPRVLLAVESTQNLQQMQSSPEALAEQAMRAVGDQGQCKSDATGSVTCRWNSSNDPNTERVSLEILNTTGSTHLSSDWRLHMVVDGGGKMFLLSAPVNAPPGSASRASQSIEVSDASPQVAATTIDEIDPLAPFGVRFGMSEKKVRSILSAAGFKPGGKASHGAVVSWQFNLPEDVGVVLQAGFGCADPKTGSNQDCELVVQTLITLEWFEMRDAIKSALSFEDLRASWRKRLGVSDQECTIDTSSSAAPAWVRCDSRSPTNAPMLRAGITLARVPVNDLKFEIHLSEKVEVTDRPADACDVFCQAAKGAAEMPLGDEMHGPPAQ